MRTAPPIFGLLLIILFSAGFLFGGGYLLYWQKTGEPTTADVTHCVQKRRSEVCDGTWFVKGNFHMGIIENADIRDLGKTIEVRAFPDGDRAVKPGLRLPIVLFSLGVGIAVLGAYWWIREVPRIKKV